MLSRIKSWLRGMDRPLGEGRHLVEQTWPAAVYAIGDVHGCIDQLRRLEERIAADAELHTDRVPLRRRPHEPARHDDPSRLLGRGEAP